MFVKNQIINSCFNSLNRYTDADGKSRVVEYGANKYGFQPSGEGITVAPITIHEDDTFDYEEEPRQQPKPKQQVIKIFENN